MKNTRNSADKVNTRSSVGLCILLALVFLALALISCGKNTVPNGEAAPTGTPMPPATAAPLSGGTLRMAIPENLSVGNESYDPMIVNTEEALTLYSLVYEPLIAINEANELAPCLAAKWSRMEGDDRSWLISLRESAVFHSGEKLCADDVVHSFNCLKRLGSESYYSYSLSSVQRIVKVDASTVRVTMRSSGIAALYALDFPIKRADGSVFNGTGPYRADSYDDERILLRANSSWWDRTPYISTVEFLARSSNDTALASYAAGQLDLVPTALLSAGRFAENGVTVVRDHMTQGMETMVFNHRRHPTMDADFRRGIAHAINRGPIISNVYMNRARACDVPVPPDSWLYSGENLIGFDAAAASAYFEKAGCTVDGEGRMLMSGEALELTLLVSGTTDNTTRSDAAALIASQLDKFGISVNIVVLPHGYGEDASEFLTALYEMDWDIALVGFNLAVSNDLSPYLAADGKNNFGMFPGVLLSDELEGIRSAQDEESLREAFRAMQSAFTEQLPFIVLYFRLNSVVCTARLGGMTALREPSLLRGIKNWYYSN